jgi:hypothetical protein
VSERDAGATTPPLQGNEKPVVDLSAALGEAGHEVEDLGYEGVPDKGDVLKDAGEQESELDVEGALDAVTEVCPPD